MDKYIVELTRHKMATIINALEEYTKKSFDISSKGDPHLTQACIECGEKAYEISKRLKEGRFLNRRYI